MLRFRKNYENTEKKKISHTYMILAVKAVKGLSEFVKKWKFLTKIFFSDNFEWSSKNLWKMISADVIYNICNNK